MKKEDFMKIVRSKAKETLTEQDENFFGSIGEAVESAMNAESVERTKQLGELAKKLGAVPEGETMADVVRNMATQIDLLEKKAERGFTGAEKYKLKSMLESKKEDIQRARQGGNPWSIEFKAKRAASALMQTTTVLTGAAAVNTMNVFDDMDIVVIEYPKNFILDGINSRQVAKVPQTVARKEEITAGEGVPVATGEGVAKALVDKKFTWKYDTRVKYAGRLEMTEEVEIDFDQLVLQIVAMFEDDVIRSWQDGVLTAILNWADTYTTTGLDGAINNPGVYNVIGAGVLHVRNNLYEPDVIFLNPTDVAKIVYMQDNNGNQMFIPESLQFAGLTPFISTKITAGKVLIGTRRTVKEQHGNFIIRKGVHGDQFIENESTIVGEIFSVLSLPTQSQPSWIYLDIATVAAALQKV